MSLFEQPFVFLRAAAPHRAFWLFAPLLLYVGTLNEPFVSDDLFLLLKAERFLVGQSDDARLYRFAANDDQWNELRNRGTLPWWLPKTGRLDFLRPVSEASFLLDVRLFGRKVFGHRLMSLAIFAVALSSVHWMFMQATADRTSGRPTGDRIRAGVATFFFGISQTVAPPVTWLCNRQDLLVVIGVTLAAGSYLSLRQHPCVRYVLLAFGGFLFALLSKEVAVALAAVVLVHALITRSSIAEMAARRMVLVTVIGLLAIVAAYLAYYASTRSWVFNVAGAESEPTQLGAQLPQTLLLYAAVWSLGFPIDVLHIASDRTSWMVAGAGGLMMLLTIRYLRRSARGDGAALFLVLWLLLFTLPGLRALTASARTLCTATIGWAYLISTILVPTQSQVRPTPMLVRHFVLAVNGVVSIGCIIGTVLVLTGTEKAACERLKDITAHLTPPLQDNDVLIISDARSQFEMICAGERLEYLTGRRGVCLHYLHPPGVAADLSASDETTLVMQARSGSLLGAPLHYLTRGDDWRPTIGQTFSVRHFTATVTAVDAVGDVTRMEFHFPRGLHATGIHLHLPDLIDDGSASENKRLSGDSRP